MVLKATATVNLAAPGTVGGTTPGIGIFITTRTTGYTVAGLPAGIVGDRAYVTDALAPTYGAVVVGGGAVVVPVFRNATVWVSV